MHRFPNKLKRVGCKVDSRYDYVTSLVQMHEACFYYLFYCAASLTAWINP